MLTHLAATFLALGDQRGNPEGRPSGWQRWTVNAWVHCAPPESYKKLGAGPCPRRVESGHGKSSDAHTSAAHRYCCVPYLRSDWHAGQAEPLNLNLNRQKSGVDAGGGPNALAQAIATGHVTPERMSYLLSRNPGLVEGVMQIDPSFDSSKAQAYPATYKDFTSGKTAVAINAGATALGHLQELSRMNTNESHIPGTPDYNAYQNKADTVASELAKFYGDATIPAIAAIKKTLTATLPGNRQAAIRTQAESMGDKLDAFQQQWENAAPSKVYQAPMPGISEKAMAARRALAGGGFAQSVKMQAPNGQIKIVPADQVDHYTRLGAKVVR